MSKAITQSKPEKGIKIRFILEGVLIAAVFSVYMYFIYKRAWLGDDIYITLRTVDNFTHGLGPVWNSVERVQAFTHPLWMFLLSAFYAVTHEAYFTTITVSLLVSFLAGFILFFFVARDRLSGGISLLLLAASSAYLDYSTSGLENPLTHLLLALAALVIFRQKESPQSLLALSLIVSLLAVNRLDLLLLGLPVLLYAFWKIRSWRNLGKVVLGQIPLFAWEAFSIIYYGFPFPNTAYAKLNVALPWTFWVSRGWEYTQFTLLYDPWTMAAIVLSIVLLFLIPQRSKAIAIIIGMGLYIAYLFHIGGDFMGGRMFTPVFFLAVVLLTQVRFPKYSSICWSFIFALALCFSYYAFIPPWRAVPVTPPPDYVAFSGITDERMYYYTSTSLNCGLPWEMLPNYPWRFDGQDMRTKGTKVKVAGGVGFMGYYAGPRVYIVDDIGLGNAFLARLHSNLGISMRIGHFIRDIPQGYVETIETGKNQIQSAGLKEYYSHLQSIISGNLWSRERWQNIWKMNSGQFNYLLALPD